MKKCCSHRHEELYLGLRANFSSHFDGFKDIFKLAKKDVSAKARQLLEGLFRTARGERNLERMTGFMM